MHSPQDLQSYCYIEMSYTKVIPLLRHYYMQAHSVVYSASGYLILGISVLFIDSTLCMWVLTEISDWINETVPADGTAVVRSRSVLL